MHNNCYVELFKFLENLPKEKNLSVLDIGSRDVNGSFRDSFPKNYTYLGVDIEAGNNVDIVLSNPHRWAELDGQQFDVLISANTIEHVEDIYAWFKEFGKFLKSGGYFYINSPVIHHIHRYPIDCWRVLPDGMKFLIEKQAGLVIKECFCSENDLITIGNKL